LRVGIVVPRLEQRYTAFVEWISYK
jgi:hypothetical protein